MLAPLLALQEQTELVRGRRTEFERVVAERDSAVLRANELETVRAENERFRAVMRLRSRMTVLHTWTHPYFRASASTRDGRVSGIVAPRVADGATTFLELREVPYFVEVTSGDSIVTSGLGGVYPRGIPVGIVRQLIGEQTGFTKTYLIEPAVRLTTLSHVLIILTVDVDVERVFSSGGR